MERLCTPAIIYVVFSIVQIIMDLYTGLINTAVIKFCIMIIMTILLNILCQRDLAIISWIIVFIPFIMMTFIVSLILYIFGLSKATGKEEHSETDDSKTAEFTAPAMTIIPNVYSQETPYNPQPSINPPAMGYPPANTYQPAKNNKPMPPPPPQQQPPMPPPPPQPQPQPQQQQLHEYNYMNISKFYPYPMN